MAQATDVAGLDSGGAPVGAGPAEVRQLVSDGEASVL